MLSVKILYTIDLYCHSFLSTLERFVLNNDKQVLLGDVL